MEIDLNNLHHAYLILSDKKPAEEYLGRLFKDLEIKPENNPDLHYFEGISFGIDDARRLKSFAEAKAFGKKKFFLIFSEEISLEAQNALLKVFEEPGENTHFFIINKKNTLLPTLLSRLEIKRLNSLENFNKDAELFLESSIEKRIEYIKTVSKDDNFSLSNFLEELLHSLKKRKASVSDIQNVFHFSKYSLDPAANTRLILEHLALTLA